MASSYNPRTGIISLLDGLQVTVAWTDDGRGGSIGVFLADANLFPWISVPGVESAGFVGLPAVGFRQVVATHPVGDTPNYVAWSSSADAVDLFMQESGPSILPGSYTWKLTFELIPGGSSQTYHVTAVRQQDGLSCGGTLIVPNVYHDSSPGWRLGFGAVNGDVMPASLHRIDSVTVNFGDSGWRRIG
jgi:hypothetical protein